MAYSDLVIVRLLASEDREASSALERFRDEVGQDACVRRMLSVFEQRLSGEVCEKAWESALMICLTDADPRMDQDTAAEWTKALLAALHDQSPSIRKAAASCLGFGLPPGDFTEPILQHLVDALTDEAEEVRHASGHVLGRAGAQAIPYVLPRLLDARFCRPFQDREGDLGSIWLALCVIDDIFGTAELEPLDRQRCANAVAEFLQRSSTDDGTDDLDIWKAGDTLGEAIGGDLGLAKLCVQIPHPDPRVRASVAHGLGHIPSDESTRTLEVLTRDPDTKVRQEAMKSLLLRT